MLHSEFFQRILRLPLVYSYGEYRDLFRDYGTHYIIEATLGGTYEYTLIMNRNELEKEGMIEERGVSISYLIYAEFSKGFTFSCKRMFKFNMAQYSRRCLR